MPIICSPQQVTCWGYDDNYVDASFPIEVTTLVDEEVDLGSLSLCETVNDEYVIIEVLGETIGFVDSVYTYTGNGNLHVHGFTLAGLPQYVHLVFEDSSMPSVLQWIETNNIGFNGSSYVLDADNPELEVTFSNYTQVPQEYLEFSFIGTYYEVVDFDIDLGSPVVITGNARVQRSN